MFYVSKSILNHFLFQKAPPVGAQGLLPILHSALAPDELREP